MHIVQDRHPHRTYDSKHHIKTLGKGSFCLFFVEQMYIWLFLLHLVFYVKNIYMLMILNKEDKL